MQEEGNATRYFRRKTGTKEASKRKGVKEGGTLGENKTPHAAERGKGEVEEEPEGGRKVRRS